jgi:hypothetical protein
MLIGARDRSARPVGFQKGPGAACGKGAGYACNQPTPLEGVVRPDDCHSPVRYHPSGRVDEAGRPFLAAPHLQLPGKPVPVCLRRRGPPASADLTGVRLPTVLILLTSALGFTAIEWPAFLGGGLRRASSPSSSASP